MMRALLVCLLLAMSQISLAEDGTRRFYGYAYDLDSDRYIYTEVHEQVWKEGRWASGTIRYYAPDNTLWGVKKLDFSADPYIPLYEYSLPAQGYAEGITAIDTKVTLTKTSDGKTKTEQVDKKDPITGDSGFHNFLLAHFQPLIDRQTVAFTFIAAGNLDSYKFRARRIDDARFEGKPAARFKVEANSLLRLVAPDLEVSYDPDTQRLLEYRGPSNVINPDTGKVFDARIAYYSEPPADAPTTLPPLQ